MLSRTQEIVVTEAEEGIVPSDAYHPPLLIDLPFENFNADMKDISDGYYRCFNSADYMGLDQFLSSIVWDDLLGTEL